MSRAVVALLTVDAWLTLPPMPLEYQGRDTCDFVREIRDLAPI